MRFSKTRKLWSQRTFAFFAAANHLSGPLMEQNITLKGFKRSWFVKFDWWILIHFVCFCVSRFVACDCNYDWRPRKTQLWRRLLNCRVRVFVKSVVIHQSIPAAPRPSGLLRSVYPPCQSRGWGICKFCSSWGPSICQPRAGLFQSFWYARGFLSEFNYTEDFTSISYWLNCQGQEKIEEGCKYMFSILCMHFFIAYQARITWWN